jgi:hypothetical protein
MIDFYSWQLDLSRKTSTASRKMGGRTRRIGTWLRDFFI